jgi:DNA-binding NarL/FixJ family response regulator
MSEPIRILLVDDQELIRVGFRLVLEAEPDMVIVGEAAEGEAAVAQARRLRPDVILMDVRMPGVDGIAATERIVQAEPSARVLVLTTFDLDEYAFGAIQAGASGFLLKDVQRNDLTAAIRSVHGGDAVLAPRVTRWLLDHVASRMPGTPTGPDPATLLTERENEVYRAIGRGLTNTEIAQSLFLSESTVKTHVGRVLAKIGARDRVHAVILAQRWGHVSLD